MGSVASLVRLARKKTEIYNSRYSSNVISSLFEFVPSLITASVLEFFLHVECTTKGRA
jgi:hypothetical protein